MLHAGKLLFCFGEGVLERLAGRMGVLAVSYEGNVLELDTISNDFLSYTTSEGDAPVAPPSLSRYHPDEWEVR